jgi:hypothetical protein
VFTWAVVGIVFSATTGTVTRFEALGSGTKPSLGETDFQPLVGLGSKQLTETTVQFKIKATGTLRNLFANFFVNDTTTAATTITTRKNTAAGGQSISIGAGLTGMFEDTSGTDSVVSGDLVNYQTAVAAGGSGNPTYGNIGCEFFTTNRTFHLVTASNAGVSVAANSSLFYRTGWVAEYRDARRTTSKRLRSPGMSRRTSNAWSSRTRSPRPRR